MFHKDSSISSIAFSKDFSVLATAAADGFKIVDPLSLEVFSRNIPVSISPLFIDTVPPKYHVVMGGISAIQAAQSKQSGC